ncbi:MAG: hypothetical protein JNM00_11660, partial [Flavobacteriales bacterium]|nr:hypothetical protein [Flavobacteriales bacterium]
MQFARLLSFVFHPLWMPLVTYYSVYLLDDSVLLTPHGHYLILLLLCLSIIAPAMSIMIMIRHGLLSNLELSERKERTVPYLIVLFYYALMLVVLWWRAPSLPGPVFSM